MIVYIYGYNLDGQLGTIICLNDFIDFQFINENQFTVAFLLSIRKSSNKYDTIPAYLNYFDTN